ncbi:SDR family oxidoreductase [Streptomyces sp. SPB162]|uniref:NAD-dependent epimerase/dehydratase family protein n=1 Tax=Streptomyces sp. SPB162 TaxID=2940560 RepID=UPI0024055BD2|nr:SDR family oxidoreductase [Streptomyces sp. SPB162]MDF9811460.1 nucleoside-diphosphate-sugar epimerase [Streptomyces sp. SPB162]
MAVRTVLVTGGAGYLGSCLVDLLGRQGYTVISLDNGMIPDHESSHENVRHIRADIRDVSDWRSLMPTVDAVVHLAGLVGDPACSVNHDLTWEINYLGTVYVAEAARKAGVQRFVFASTCSNYGLSFGTSADTFSPLFPQSVYAASKIQAEHYLLSVRGADFSPAILRFATLFGISPRMRFDLAINIMTARAAMEGSILVINGEQWRPFLHVRDCAKIVASLIPVDWSRPGAEIYNCGSDRENFKISEIGRIIQEEIPLATLDIKKSADDMRDYRVDFDLQPNSINFNSPIGVREGIREIRDALEQGLFADYSNRDYNNYETLIHRLQEGHLSTSLRHDHPWPELVSSSV